MADEDKKLQTLHMGDIVTGSGLKTRDDDIYSRVSHRRRSLELYSSRPGSPQNRERRPTSPQKRESAVKSKFPLELETFEIIKRPGLSRVEVEKDQVEREQELPAGDMDVMLVSGNYIPPPPGTLSFARRTGKFYPSSSASADIGSPLNITATAVKKRAYSEQVPQLRVHRASEQYPPL